MTNTPNGSRINVQFIADIWLLSSCYIFDAPPSECANHTLREVGTMAIRWIHPPPHLDEAVCRGCNRLFQESPHFRCRRCWRQVCLVCEDLPAVVAVTNPICGRCHLHGGRGSVMLDPPLACPLGTTEEFHDNGTFLRRFRTSVRGTCGHCRVTDWVFKCWQCDEMSCTRCGSVYPTWCD